MKITVTDNIFIDHMRAIRPDNFSYEGLQALFAYLEEAEQCTDYEHELDPIGICCDFSQCSLKEFIDAYSVREDFELSEGADWEEMEQAINDYICKNGFWYAFVEDSKCVVFENF